MAGGLGDLLHLGLIEPTLGEDLLGRAQQIDLGIEVGWTRHY